MSAIFADSPEGLVRTSAVVASSSDYTVMAWVYFESIEPVNYGILTYRGDNPITLYTKYTTMNAGPPDDLEVSSDAVGSWTIVGSRALNTLTRQNLWRHVAYTYNAATGDFNFYLDGLLVVMGNGTLTGTYTHTLIGTDTYPEGFGANRRFAYVGEWTSVLTNAQIKVQRLSMTPLLSAYSWATLDADLNDSSGNARHWSAYSGTITFGDQPPIGGDRPGATRQTFLGRRGSMPGNVTRYANPIAGGQSSAWSAAAQPQLWGLAGEFDNLYITLTAAPGVGNTVAFTFQINGVDTALTLTISGTSTTGSSEESVSVADGDTVALKAVSSTSAASSTPRWAVEFVAASGTAVSGYGFTDAADAALVVQGATFGSYAWLSTTVDTQVSVVAASGTVARLKVQLSGSPGAGKSYTFVLLKNGVVQDGAGTTNTVVTIADSATTGEISFALMCVAGDRLQTRCTPTGTPTGRDASVFVSYVADTDGEFNLGGFTNSILYINRWASTLSAATGWDTLTESDFYLYGGLSSFTVSALHVRVVAAYPADATFTLRKNGADTALTIPFYNVAAGSDLVNTVAIAAGDAIDLACVGGGFSLYPESHGLKGTNLNPAADGGGGGGVGDDPGGVDPIEGEVAGHALSQGDWNDDGDMDMSGILLPWGKQQFFDADGDALGSGFVYFWKPGTDDQTQTVYQNAALSSTHSQPVALDAEGRATIYLDPSLGYKIVVQDSNHAQVYALDNHYIPQPTSNICEGRLTITSATPFVTTDVSAATTLYFAQVGGNLIDLYDGTRWWPVTFDELSISLAGLTASTPYDVFVYNSGTQAVPVPALALTAWTNTTTRATGVTRLNGRWVKSGATGYRWVGAVHINSTGGQTDWTHAKRYIYNEYNQAPVPLRRVDGTDTWSYGTATIRQANAAAANKVEVMVGRTGIMIEVEVIASAIAATADYVAKVAIGEDSTTAAVSGSVYGVLKQTATAVSMAGTMVAKYCGYVPLGYHYYAWLESASNTTTFYGDNGTGANAPQSGMNGVIWM